MKSKNLYLIIILINFIISCGSATNNTPNPDHRLKFIGTYNMTKLEDNSNYVMTIDTLGSYCGNGNNCDSIKLSNFGELFNLKYIQSQTIPEGWINWPFYNPIIDHNGHRWHLTWGYSGPDAPTHYNAIYGDSIKISFRINNILYYFDDGVPYKDTILTHVGIRQ